MLLDANCLLERQSYIGLMHWRGSNRCQVKVCRRHALQHLKHIAKGYTDLMAKQAAYDQHLAMKPDHAVVQSNVK